MDNLLAADVGEFLVRIGAHFGVTWRMWELMNLMISLLVQLLYVYAGFFTAFIGWYDKRDGLLCCAALLVVVPMVIGLPMTGNDFNMTWQLMKAIMTCGATTMVGLLLGAWLLHHEKMRVTAPR